MRRIASVLVCLAIPASAARAQWHIGADAGVLQFGAVARDTASEVRRASLGSTVTAGVRLDRVMARWRIALGAGTGRVGFAIEDDSVSVGVKHAFRFVELRPEVAVRLATAATGASLWLEAGPVLGIWLPDGSDARVRGGAFGGAAVAVPLLRRLSGSFSVHATVTASPFHESELVAGFVSRAAPRVSAQVGVRYQL